MLAASPRDGNCLEAARLFCEGFNQAPDGAASPLRPILLRDYRVLPCLACGVCDLPGTACPQAGLDDSAELFGRFLGAPLLALAAPIFFCHLPSSLKALLDRCQFYYAAGLRRELRCPPRRAFVLLAAARSRGEKLFSGSLLSLELALRPFNVTLADPLLLRGLDGPEDLARREDLRESVRCYGRLAAGSPR
jgi:multimeric flavodoxin WrbA